MLGRVAVAQVALAVEPHKYADTERKVILKLEPGRVAEDGGDVHEVRVAAELGIEGQLQVEERGARDHVTHLLDEYFLQLFAIIRQFDPVEEVGGHQKQLDDDVLKLLVWARVVAIWSVQDR